MFMDILNATQTKTCKILIVDDEGDICYLLSKLLKQRDLVFDQVNTLAQAEIMLKEEKTDIIFLDNNLPDGLGLNFIDAVKSLYPGIKIAMITAHDSIQNKNKAIKKGADYFIPKPFTSKEIFKCIDELSCSNS